MFLISHKKGFKEIFEILECLDNIRHILVHHRNYQTLHIEIHSLSKRIIET